MQWLKISLLQVIQVKPQVRPILKPVIQLSYVEWCYIDGALILLT